MSKLFYRDKPIVGLDISQTGLKAMSVSQKKPLVIGYGSLDLDPARMQKSLDGKDDYLSKNIKNLFSKKIIGRMPSKNIVLSVPTSRTYARTFTLPLEAEGNLQEAINLEAEQYIPVPLAQLYTDHQVIEYNKDNLVVLMCAVPKTIVDACVDAVRGASMEVVMVEPGINAVARLLTLTEEGHLPTVIVDIGPTTTDIAILDGSIRVTGSIVVGGNTFTLDIAKKMKVPLESAHQLKVLHGLGAGPRQAKISGALEPNLKRIIAETKKVIRYYNERLGSTNKLEQVLVVGGGSGIPGLGDYFTNALVMPARLASPWQTLDFGKLSQPSKQFKPRYTTAGGLSSIKPKDIWQ